jgi:4'-phosphopantetheinyl transferase EntD
MVALVPLDRTHIAVQTLERLLPEAIIEGGSFGLDLRHPTQIPRSERQLVFEAAQTRAIDDCIRKLCGRAALPELTQVGKGPGGERLWPNGFVGSLTHKGTVVLGALAAKSVFRALGIDIEFIDSSELGAIKKNVAWEGLPPGTDQSQGVLLALSAKEAVFKAQYPLTGALLGFSDVALKWASHSAGTFSANVDCGSAIGFQVRCAATNAWVVSTAVMSAKT